MNDMSNEQEVFDALKPLVMVIGFITTVLTSYTALMALPLCTRSVTRLGTSMEKN